MSASDDRIAAILNLHRPAEVYLTKDKGATGAHQVCTHDSHTYPCATVRLSLGMETTDAHPSLPPAVIDLALPEHAQGTAT